MNTYRTAHAGEEPPLDISDRARLDRDLNAARNLAALADQAVLGELRPDVKRPDGNPRKTGMAGNGYRRGKAQIMSQGRLREVATP